MKPYADHFSRLAPEYAECRPAYPGELFEYLSSLVGRHELAWDCATGNGQAAVPLAALFRRVLATDASAAMLGGAAPLPTIEYRVAPAEDSGLEARSADLVTVAQALHWLDLPPFYAEVDRVLVPGGVLAVWTYGAQALDDAVLDRELARFYADVVGPYWPPERRHVESGYRDLPLPYIELRPPSFTMEARWTLSHLAGYVRTWSATQRFRETQGYDPVVRLEDALARPWGGTGSVRRVRWPLSLRVTRRPLKP